jgi:polar amino acid transport system substrate-binding protein
MRGRIFMKKIFLAIGFVFVAIALFITPAGAADDGSWERVKAAGKLVIGIDDAFPPMEFRNEKGELVGFDIDASRELGKRLGIEIEHQPTAWKGVIMSLKTKKFDIIWSGMSITAEREKEIAFSKPYIMEKQIMVVAAGNDKIKSVNDLGEASIVGVQLGSTSEEALASLNKKFKEIKRYDKNTEAFMDLKIGRIDALAVDELVGRYFLSQRAHQGREAFRARHQRDIRVSLRNKFRGVVDQILGRVAAGGAVAGLGWIGADKVRQSLCRIGITAEGKTAAIGAVCDEAHAGDVVDDAPELLAEAGIGSCGLGRIRHQMHGRLCLFDILFLLDELATADQHRHAVVDLHL